MPRAELPDLSRKRAEVTYAARKKVTSLYIHVPFCSGKCFYCDFYSLVTRDNRIIEDWYRGLELELDRIAREAPAKGVDLAPLETLYFGGGTPSLLPPDLIASLVRRARSLFGLAASCDITLEANPESVEQEAFLIWREAGVNRISFGLQSASDRLLEVLGRRHSAQMTSAALIAAREAGFQHLAVDLMTGLPGQTLEDVEETLDFIEGLPVDHVSTYALTIPEHTPFHKLWKKSPDLFPDDELERRMTDRVKDRLQSLAFEHYEISNFAKEGARSRHNLVYWRADPYLAAGPAAASYMAGVRRCNPASLDAWLKILEDPLAGPLGQATLEEEVDEAAARLETMILGLRFLEGVNRQDFLVRHGIDFDSLFGDKLTDLEARGLIERDQTGVRLTRTGLDYADLVARQLL